MCIGKRADDRKCCAGRYRYGFNGKEKDTDGEWGSSTHYDFGARIYNPAIGKFLSVDPLTKGYPAFAPYSFAANTPLMAIDKDGENFIIITWHSKTMDQGHAALAIANTHVIIENGVEKLVHDGTFSVYEVTTSSLGGGNVTDYINDVSKKFDGLMSKKPQVYTKEELLNLRNGHGDGRAVSGAVEFVSSAQDDRINAEVLNSMITVVAQIKVPDHELGGTTEIDVITNNNISYSLIDSEDNCTFSCASFVIKSASLLYGIDLGKPEHIKTRAKNIFIDRDGSRADIPDLNVNAHTPNSVFKNAAFKGDVLKGKYDKGNYQNFIDQVTGGQIKDETPNN